MANTRQVTVDVPEEDAEVLDRAIESNTVENLADAADRGFSAVVEEQLSIERRMHEVIIPRFREIEDDPSAVLSVEEAKERTAAIVAERRRRAA